MNNTHNILIRDPYLESQSNIENSHPNLTMNEKTRKPYPQTNPNNWKWGQQQSKTNNDLLRQLNCTKNQLQQMKRAYSDGNRFNQKIVEYQHVNNQYHEALKMRNLDLNNKLTGLATDNRLLSQKLEADHIKNYHDKDELIRKYQLQNQEIFHLKRTVSDLYQLKSQMQDQIERLHFTLDNQAERFSLEVKQQIIRIQGMERTMKNMSETKDNEISYLRQKLKSYEDENRRLNDENRTLILTNKEGENKKTLQNISQIHHLDSQTKSHHKDPFSGTFERQFVEQKNINDKLQKQINELQKKLFGNDNEDGKKANRGNSNHQETMLGKLDLDRFDGFITSIISLRSGIVKDVFDVFSMSVKDGQKHKSNSLVIFIENWTHLDLNKLEPYVQSYFQARKALQALYKQKKNSSQINPYTTIGQKIEQCIPLNVGNRKGRNQINQWILSTIQFTKNQRESSKKSMNNLLLFLFRLLTIQYRITYPMQGKSYTIDNDVKYELLHEIVKAIDYIRKFQ